MSTDVAALQQGDLLIFNSSSALSLPKYANDTTKTVAMPMDIRIDKNLLISDGYSNTVYNFSGSISGTANFTSAISTSAKNQTYNFSGSLANFTGALSLSNKVTTTFQDVGTVGATSISLAGPTTIAGNFSTSGSLTSTGTLTNNGTLTISGSYTGGTISQSEGATLTLGNGSVVNLDALNSQNSLANSDQSGIQSYQRQYSLVSGGSVSKAEDATVAFKLGDAEVEGMLSNGSYTLSSSSNCYNIASGTSQTYSEVSTAIGTESVDFINVIGTLTELSYVRGTTPLNIKGTGTVQVNGVLEYHSTTDHTFLNDFSGILEIVSGGDVRLGATTEQLGNLTKIKVLSDGILRGYSSAKPRADLELAGGTLLASGQNWTYGSGILVSADSRLSQDGSETLTITGDITNLNNAGITSTGTVTLQGAVTLGSYTIQNGTVTMEGNATLGDIIVQSGTLNLGKVSGEAYAAKEISVGDVTVNAGATFSVGYTKGTVKSVSLAADSTLRYYDNQNGTEITNAPDTTNITSLRVNAAANLQADWKGTLNISELTGAGNLALSKTKNAYDPYFYLNISSIKDYSGTITGPTSNESFVRVTIGGANISDAASTATVSANVTLKNGFTKTGAGAVSFSGTTTATDVTVSSGCLTFAGETSVSKLTLNGGSTTISGATSVSGVKGDGIIAASDTIKLTVSDTGTLTHDGFQYTGTELSGLSHGLTLWNKDDYGSTSYNVSVTGGTITQTQAEKTIHAALSGVKLINGTDNSDMITTLGANANLSAATIAGKLIVEKETTVTGAATVSGTAEVRGTLSTGADSSITTLTGSGTLKANGGTTEATNASGFTGTLDAAGGNLTASGGIASLTAVKATGGNITLQGAASLTLTEVVVSSDKTILAYTEDSNFVNFSAKDVRVGEGGGSLIGNLSIGNGGTLTLNAVDGTSGKGLSLSYPISTLADVGPTSTSGSLTLGSGLTLNLLNLNVKQGDSLTLFSGVTGVNGIDDMVALKSGSLEANTVFTNLTAGDFMLSFDETNHIVALVAQRDVPEPTTATLSLLALMGLAARRRRRKA
ncbi:MAG: PEP-CTERM sorting domain-containing protein [Akkermansia muciniphila]|nr:PEP-CTERM sorting domain-containing protein [Akkermansia muciniphila]